MIVRLSKEMFWNNFSAIERWPEILKRLPRRMECRGKYEIAAKYLSSRTKKGRIIKTDEVYGLFGAENNGGQWKITGCNFIKDKEGGYELTEAALELARAYEQNDGWEKLLASQLLKYSVRVRIVAVALCNGGHLEFAGGYLKNLTSSCLFYQNEQYYIFSSKPGRKNLNDLLNRHPREAVGKFWLEEMEAAPDEDVTVRGMGKVAPSLKDIGTYLKMPLGLFHYLEWIKERQPGRFVLEQGKVKEDVSKELYDSLLLPGRTDEIQILKELIAENADYRGFFALSRVGELLKEIIEPDSHLTSEQWIDRYFMTGFNERRFQLDGHEQGQPRHGRGLLGRKDYQLIKIKFNG